MTVSYRGNIVTVIITAGEGNPPVIQLSDGYTYEKIHILVSTNVVFLFPYMNIQPNQVLNFPCVNETSPCTIQPFLRDTSEAAELKFLIEKFGKIPNTHYFDKAFEPILVTGDDGTEYNVIPSDQFK